MVTVTGHNDDNIYNPGSDTSWKARALSFRIVRLSAKCRKVTQLDVTGIS